MAWRKEAKQADRQLHAVTCDFERSNRFSEYARLRDRETLKVFAHRPTPLSLFRGRRVINQLGFNLLEDALWEGRHRNRSERQWGLYVKLRHWKDHSMVRRRALQRPQDMVHAS